MNGTDKYDLQLWESLEDRVDTAVSLAGGRSGVPEWICKNTKNPKNKLRHWSFKDHEYQIEILNDKAPHIVIEKCAQMGISEAMVRLILALLAKLTGENGIYVLPSSKFSGKFAVNRVDPVIAASPRLKSLVSKEVNSTELKQIGTCFLHFGGAQSENQAISVPARILFRDEKSFGNPDILSVYQSRLGHNDPKDRIIVDFSTPLYPEMGISADFQEGDQRIYMVYHESCGRWVDPSFIEQVILPGFDRPIIELTPSDLRDSRVKVNEAFIQCPHCSQEISRANLSEPSYRAWVPTYQDREIHSYHIDPLAASGLRSVPQIINDLKLYKTTARWVQYALGSPYEASDSTIVKAAVESCFTVTPLPSSVSTVWGAVAGMDVGKVSHLVNGKKVNGVLEIFNMELVKQGGDNELGDTFVSRFTGYNCVRGVIDAEPDVSVVKYVQGRTAYNRVWGSYFVRSRHRSSLELYELKEEDGIVNSRRTLLIDEFVADFNGGKIKLPRGLRFQKEVASHLERPKRITNFDALGEESAVWVSKNSEDHWFFAILYCWLAARMVEETGGTCIMPASHSLVSVTPVGSRAVARPSRR